MHELPIDFAPFARAAAAAYNYSLIRGAETDTEAWLHQDRLILPSGGESSTVGIVAFRGTETGDLASLWDDLKTDLDGGLVEMRTRVDVREGFAKAYKEVRDRVIQLVRGNLDNNGIAYITGHSLGGALACIAANDIAPMNWCAGVKLVTFGQPRVFGHTSAMHWQCDYWRVVNNNDIVPSLPPPVTPIGHYRHTGQRVYLDTDGKAHQDISVWSEWIDRVEGAASHIGTPGLDMFADHAISEYVRVCEGITA